MNATPMVSWLMIVILAGGAFLLLAVIVAVIAAVSSKSKAGTGVAIAIVAAILLGLPVLGVIGFVFLAAGRSTPVRMNAQPTVVDSVTMPAEQYVPAMEAVAEDPGLESQPADESPLVEPAEAREEH